MVKVRDDEKQKQKGRKTLITLKISFKSNSFKRIGKRPLSLFFVLGCPNLSGFLLTAFLLPLVSRKLLSCGQCDIFFYFCPGFRSLFIFPAGSLRFIRFCLPYRFSSVLFWVPGSNPYSSYSWRWDLLFFHFPNEFEIWWMAWKD